MSNIIEIVVPDIGNFDSVDVIEVLVKAGDVIAESSMVSELILSRDMVVKTPLLREGTASD